jgi:hypothetical protein
MSDSLLDWLKKDLAQRGYHSPEESLVDAIGTAERIIQLHLRRPNKPRPSVAARKFSQMAKHLRVAAEAATELGTQELLTMGAMTGQDLEFDETDAARHILYLERMATLAGQAAQVARARAKDDRGGPTPDQRMRSIIAQLMLTYENQLGLRPTHTSSPDKGLSEVGFTGFVKAALEAFAPGDLRFNPHQIDSIVRELLPLRDLELFEPPPLWGRPDPRAGG